MESGKIEMEKNLSELLSYFEVPSYVILLVGLALFVNNSTNSANYSLFLLFRR